MKKVFPFLRIFTLTSLLLSATVVNAQDLIRAASTSGDGKPDANSLNKGQIDGQSIASEYAGVVASQAWSVTKDKAVDILADETEAALAAITTNVYGRLIRDEWGQIYKITPKGKRLPLGLSPETIQDIAIERGFNLERVKLTTQQAKQLGDRIKGGWTIFNFGRELWKINNDETLTPEEQQNRIIIETIAAEANILVGRGISTLATAGNIGTVGTLGAGLVAGVALDRVKTAFITYQEMTKAMEEALEAEANAERELLRMANTKVAEISKAIEEGNLDKADEMASEMASWASRRAFGRNAIPEMWDIYRMCDGMRNDIYTTRRQIEQEAIDAYNRRLAEYAKEQKEARKREEELDRLFSIEATATKYTLAPEETTTITIAALTGTPPFTLSGVLNGTFDADNPFVLELPIGIETGHYYLPITATDAAGHVRETELGFKVVEEAQEGVKKVLDEAQEVVKKEEKSFELPEKIYVAYNVAWVNGGYFATTTGVRDIFLEYKKEGNYYIHKKEGERIVAGRKSDYMTSSKIKFDSSKKPTKIEELNFIRDSKFENEDRIRTRSFKISNLGVRIVKNYSGEVTNLHARADGYKVCDYVIEYGGENSSCTEESRLIIQIALWDHKHIKIEK